MNIKLYQKIAGVDTGSTTYDEQIADILEVDKSKPIQQVKAVIENKLHIVYKDLTKNTKIVVNGRRYKYEKDLLEVSLEQFSRLESILAEQDNINNLHRLLAIYVRPVNMFNKIRPFDVNTQDKIADELLNMNMSDAQALMIFFFNNALLSMKNMSIYYLNQRKQGITESIKTK